MPTSSRTSERRDEHRDRVAHDAVRDALPATALGRGRLVGRRAGSAGAGRPDDHEFTRGPSMPRNAGRKVRAKSTEVTTTIEPPMPIERMAGASNSSSPDSPIATASPEKTTALPAVATERSTACRPCARGAAPPEAAGHEQRVVDRQGEPEHRRDVQDVDAHLDLLRDEVDQREAGGDRKAGDEQRHAGRDAATPKTRRRTSAAIGSDTISARCRSFSDCSAESAVSGP